MKPPMYCALLALLVLLVGCGGDRPYEGMLTELSMEESAEVIGRERQRGYDDGVDAGCKLQGWIIVPDSLYAEIDADYAEAVSVYTDPLLVSVYKRGYDEGRADTKSVMRALLGQAPEC